MSTFYYHLLAYLVISFALGVVWHVVLFKDYYKKLAIYSNIENPRFVFGFSSMLLQSIVLAYVYPYIENTFLFGLGLFMIFTSFMVLAEAGKQNATSLKGFVAIQTVYSAIQAVLVTLAFYLIR